MPLSRIFILSFAALSFAALSFAALFFTALFFVSACFAEENEAAAGKFLDYLKAERFAEAVNLFSEDLRFQCSEQELSKVMNRIKHDNVHLSGQKREWKKQTGELESFDTVKKVACQNGILYESVLRFKNAVLQCRCAVNTENKITAFEFLAVPNEFVPDHGPRCFNNTEIGKILGFDHSITIELFDADESFDADAKKIDFSNYYNYNTYLYEKIDSIPGKHQEPWYWMNPKDKTHWATADGNSVYADHSIGRWEGNVCRFFGLKKGTYRFALNLTRSKKDVPKGIVFSEPMTLDENHKNLKTALRLIRGGTLKINYQDAETGQPIETSGGLNSGFDSGLDYKVLTCDQSPQCFTSGHLFPGKYTFSTGNYIRNPDDLVYTPAEEKYEAEIFDGKETVVNVKLHSRPQTKEELDKRWRYIITGTVRDIDGKPLKNAVITVRRLGILLRGYWPKQETKSDMQGRFTLRFNPEDLDFMSALEKEIKPAPEKPDIYGFRIGAECNGFVWKGIRLADGKMTADKFLDDNNQFIDWYSMVGIEPKLSDFSKVKSIFELTPDNVLYALEPKQLEIVMQPAVRLRGAVTFDPITDGVPQEPDETSNRFYNPYIGLVFDVPFTKGKNNEQPPTFSGKTGYPDYRFDISALPKNVDVFLAARWVSVPESWKSDEIVCETDSFKLPPAGDYEVELRWQTIEKHGAKVHKLAVNSMKDSGGKKLEIETVRKKDPDEVLFNRWAFTGTVRDELGKPVEDIEVKLCRYNRRIGWNFETLKTDAAGKFSVSEIKPYMLPQKYYDRNLLHGEFIAVQLNKDGFLQKEQVFKDDARLIFLSDIENPGEKSFASGSVSTDRIAEPRKTAAFDFVIPHTPVIEGVLLGKEGKPLPGYSLALQSDADIERDFCPNFQTNREGRFSADKVLPAVPFWFNLSGDRGEFDIFRTNNIVFEPGKKYEVKLQLHQEPNGSRRLVLESVHNSDGGDITAKIVTEDLRTRSLLGDDETKKGREILEKTAKAVRPMLVIESREIESVEYSFYCSGKTTNYKAEPYREDADYLNKPSGSKLGISFRCPLSQIDDIQQIRFRAVSIDDNEIHLLTTLRGGSVYGNGVSGSWAGYVQSGFDGAEFILDAKTFLPKRIKTNSSETEYFDWTPFGEGHFVPKRITAHAGGMKFDFRFKIHGGSVWFFDRSVAAEGTDGTDEKIICRIDNFKINRPVWAPEADENRVREVLRKYYAANKYWLNWYPKDLPKFGYTFHRQGGDDKILSYDAIKAADNWYAEFYRKGISYIGISRLLVIDIDSLHCKRVAEDTESGTLEFDFVLGQAWMNAAGNGISDTWNGWFNGVIRRGTAVFDTKTNTVREIRTENYDERFSDYYELKPGQFVPRRIIVDYHNGNRDETGEMFFDFRFKIYEPCLWLFDRSVKPDDGKPSVWIDNVIVDDKPGIEMK